MIPLSEVADEVLTWTRPGFLELRYELTCSKGVSARVSVSGMSEAKHALAETAEGAWRFAVFPFSADGVVITEAADQAVEAGRYVRKPPFEIHLTGGNSYRLNAVDGAKSRVVAAGDLDRLIFEIEQVEAFPRWKAEVKIDPGEIGNPDLPLLLMWACCVRLFR